MYLCINLPLVGQSPSQSLLSLVAAERAFAKATAELGVRDGFLMFFADDAVTFEPAFGPYKAQLRQRPRTGYPLSAVLRWAPETGDIGQSDDLGYLTGPYIVDQAGAPRDGAAGGWYFSIWKRQADGLWKVFIDVGIETPPHGIDPDTVSFRPARTYVQGNLVSGGGSLSGLQKADAGLNVALTAPKPDIAPYVASSLRLHRNGWQPVIGSAEVLRYLRTDPLLYAASLHASASAAGDLGYTYGTYEGKDKRGYYVRVWKWLDNADWKVVLDVTTESGP